MKKDDLKVGMYVRTNYGIGKIDKTRMFMDKYFEFHLDSNKGRIHNVDDNTYWNSLEDIIGEPSFDILELIRPGDYVNGSKVIKTKCKLEYMDDDSDTGVNEIYDGLELADGWIYFEYEIETILTKEQFEREMYKVK